MSSKRATVRHEYDVGEIYAMVGATRRHHRIAGNIFRRLANAGAGGSCRVSMETIKLQVSDEIFYYPDVMVCCGPEPENPYSEDAPCLIVEVTSPSTEPIDRREKLATYKRTPTLKAYLIVDHERVRVERYFREEEGIWRRADLGDDGRFPVPRPPQTELSLEDVYEGLEATP